MTLELQPVSATEALARALRDRILSSDIPPGTRLPELELVRSYGVARPTVREALQLLVHQGLLQRRPNHTASVPELTPDAVGDIFFARAPIELHAVRTLAARREDVPAARAAVERFQALGDDVGWSDVVEADMAFHLALMDAVGSPRLARLHAALEGEIRLCIAQLRPAWHTPSALAEEHRQVLDGILAGSEPAAVARMREHLDKAVRDLTGPRPRARARRLSRRPRAVRPPRAPRAATGPRATRRGGSRCSPPASTGRGLLPARRRMPAACSPIASSCSSASSRSASRAGRPIRRPSACTIATASPPGSPSAAASSASSGSRAGRLNAIT